MITELIKSSLDGAEPYAACALEDQLLAGFQPLVLARQAHAVKLAQEARLALEPKPDPAAIAEAEEKRIAQVIAKQNQLRAQRCMDQLDGAGRPDERILAEPQWSVRLGTTPRPVKIRRGAGHSPGVKSIRDARPHLDGSAR